MCSLSRHLLVGGLSGMAAATLSGSELIGWVAAAVVVGLMLAARRLFPARLAPSACGSAACAPSAGIPSARDEPASATSAG